MLVHRCRGLPRRGEVFSWIQPGQDVVGPGTTRQGGVAQARRLRSMARVMVSVARHSSEGSMC
jgi:hypothetical protein